MTVNGIGRQTAEQAAAEEARITEVLAMLTELIENSETVIDGHKAVHVTDVYAFLQAVGLLRYTSPVKEMSRMLSKNDALIRHRERGTRSNWFFIINPTRSEARKKVAA